LFFIPVILSAQDAHYWTNQYGTQAQLLSGLVVGAVKDLSSTYYNPGAVAISREQTLVLSTDALQFNTLEYFPEDLNASKLRSSSSAPVPNVFAVRIPLDSLRINNLAFSYLVREDVRTDLVGRSIQSDGKRVYRDVDSYIYQKYGETWIGATYSRKLNEKLGLGITQYVAIRSHRHRIQSISQNVFTDQNSSAEILFRDVYFDNVKLLWKIGIMFDQRPLSFGFSITTGSVNLFNTSAYHRLNISKIDSAGKSEIASDYQDGLISEYQTPFSAAAGAAYHFDGTSLYITAEWFAPISQEMILNTKPILSFPSSQEIPNEYSLSRKSVINFGLGANTDLSRYISLYGSFTVNRSYFNPGMVTLGTFSKYDIYHFTTGLSLKTKIVDLTLGFSYGFGNSGIGISGDRFTQLKGNLEYRNYKLIAGFNIKII
jgi:hypothetical protein